MQANDFVNAVMPDMIAWQRHIHRNPELGFAEHRASDFVAEKLEEFGLEVHRDVSETAVVGALRAGTGRRSVMFRAELDALPVLGATDLPHRSQMDGAMHACGHDAHAAMLLGGARFLSQSPNFDGTVYFVFQPAEEVHGGGRKVVADGLLERSPADKVFSQHSWSGVREGAVIATEGPIMAGVDDFTLTFHGKGAHAAMPEPGDNPVVAAAEFITSAQRIVSRTVDPRAALVVSFTQVHGGRINNIFPRRWRFRGRPGSSTPASRTMSRRRSPRASRRRMALRTGSTIARAIGGGQHRHGRRCREAGRRGVPAARTGRDRRGAVARLRRFLVSPECGGRWRLHLAGRWRSRAARGTARRPVRVQRKVVPDRGPPLGRPRRGRVAAGGVMTIAETISARNRAGHLTLGGRVILMLASNDYLGLPTDPAVVAAACDACARYGTGMTIYPVFVTSDQHRTLERELATFLGVEAVLLTVSGGAANAAALTGLVEKGDLILSDADNHASTIDAGRLSRAEVVSYRTRDPLHLAELLAGAPATGKRLIITSGVFSMDGGIAPLAGIAGTCARHDALLVVGDAHATGVVGDGGKGSLSACGLAERMPGVFITGSLFKALGGAGAASSAARSMPSRICANARAAMSSRRA